MKKLISWLRWLDNNLVTILVVGFLFIVPLYPKFPLKAIEYTYISLRLEDLYIFLTTIIFFVQVLRKKEQLNMRYFLLFFAFWCAVFISYLWGYFIQHTIRPQLMQVALLHSLRRIEYMIPFFIALSTVKSLKHFYRYINLIIVILVIACLYGLGQKFLGFPAVQTMNPAFARGLILYLTPEARVSSTFAGHYDFAAYLVLLIPLVLGLFVRTFNLLYLGAFVLSAFLLVLTASRISFGAYVVSVTAFTVFMKKFKLLIFVIAITVLLSLLNNSLVNRFFKTFQVKQIFVNENTGKVVVPQNITTKELPAGSFYIPVKDQTVKETSAKDEKLVKDELLSDIREEASRSGRILTASEEARLLATASANLTPVNTVVSDISFATRLQIEWPRAVKAFLHNPIVGTGPSSITEATDNDYLRWIGEFGLLGTTLFLFILFTIIKDVWTHSRRLNEQDRAVYYGFLFGTFALLFNAGYIDVFEASKVAFTFWTYAGIVIGSLAYVTKTSKKE